MDKIKSVLNFNGYKVGNIIFKINEEFNYREAEEVDVDVDFKVKSEIDRNNNSLKINLATTIFKESESKNNPFSLYVDINGFFEYSDNISEEMLQGLIRNNSVAILYPYLRSIVSTITCNSGFEPIILPTINITKLMKHEDR